MRENEAKRESKGFKSTLPGVDDDPVDANQFFFSLSLSRSGSHKKRSIVIQMATTETGVKQGLNFEPKFIIFSWFVILCSLFLRFISAPVKVCRFKCDRISSTSVSCCQLPLGDTSKSGLTP